MTTFSSAVHHLTSAVHLSYLPSTLLLFFFISSSISSPLLFSTALTPFFIPAPSLHLCLPPCLHCQQIYSGERVQSVLRREYLHTKWTQPDFNETAAFLLVPCQITRGVPWWFSTVSVLCWVVGGGTLLPQAPPPPHLNWLINRVGVADQKKLSILSLPGAVH